MTTTKGNKVLMARNPTRQAKATKQALVSNSAQRVVRRNQRRVLLFETVPEVE